jgi:hypothetical protein
VLGLEAQPLTGHLAGDDVFTVGPRQARSGLDSH